MNTLTKDIVLEAEDLVVKATAKGVTIGTAESCTGGLIAGAITAIPGSSAMLSGGIVSYSNALKVHLLGVGEDTLKTHGAVSEAVALEMARGALGRLDVEIAVAVTGIAGPGGGTVQKPVGTVWIAIATAQAAHARECHYSKLGRSAVRDRTVLDALRALNATVADYAT